MVTEILRSMITPKIFDYNVILDLDTKLRRGCHDFPSNGESNTPSLHLRGIMMTLSPFS